MKTSFAIQDIDRSRPNNISGNDPQASIDGACQEMVNLRYYNNAWRPMGNKKVAWANFPLANHKGLYLHNTGDSSEVWVAYNDINGYIYYYVDGQLKYFSGGSRFKKAEVEFCSLGNVLVINNKTSNVVSWAIFSRDNDTLEGLYKYIAELPKVGTIRLKSSNETHTPKTTITASSSRSTAVGLMNEFNTQASAAIALASANNLADFNLANGLLMIQCAYELIDGSVVKHSPLMVVSTVRYCCGNTNSSITNGVKSIEMEYHFGQILFQYWDDKATNYKDIIRSVNVYCSRIIPIVDPLEPCLVTSVGNSSMEWCPNIHKNVRDYSFIEKEAMYKLMSIPVEEIAKYASFVALDLRNIETKELMDVDGGTHHTLGANNVDVYNNRVILSNIQTVLFEGYTSAELGCRDEDMPIRTRIIDSNGVFVVGNYNIIIVGFKRYNFLLSYPDIRAKIIYISGWEMNGSAVRYVVKSYPLTPHPTMNLAYATSIGTPEQLGINTEQGIYKFFNTWNATTGLIYQLSKTGEQIEPDFSVEGVSLPQITDNVLRDGNRIQVTETNSPFSYPPQLSYQLEGDVIGIAFNTLPISQGQFGEHPMLAATTTGWKAMQLGTGEAYITSIVPLNGLTVNNPKSIINCDRDIVFTTDRGLWLMRGSETILISKPMEEGTTKVTMDMGQMITHPQLGNFANDPRSIVPFLEYIKEANFAYDLKENELIVSNPNYNYSYFFDFDTQFWYKKSEVYSQFASSYPKVYSVRGNDLIEISEEESGSQSILVVSRALRLGTDKFKRVEKMVCNGHIYTDTGKYCRCALYLSYDGTMFKLSDVKDMKDRALNVNWLSSHDGAKYFRLVFCGNATPEAYFTTVDTEIIETLGN